MECAEERVTDLMKAYDDYISSCTFIRMPDAYMFIANSPAPRFYVSDTRASVVVSAMLSNRKHRYNRMRPLKREMYEEICRRVKLMQEKDPSLSILACCAEVVIQPAPKFYIKPSSVKCIICKYREEWKKKKLRNFQHWQSQRR